MKPEDGRRPSLEFRIPISPTRSFFHQVRFFDASLRRLGGIYEEALLRVIVGDDASIADVEAANAWSADRRIEWVAVPREVFSRYGMHGTADYRYEPQTEAEIVILSDADTVLARPLGPLFDLMKADQAIVAGHMAHFPPPPGDRGPLMHATADTLWPSLLALFGLGMPAELYRYSMDIDRRLAPAPAYFNLGFVALTPAALEIMRQNIFSTQDRMLEAFPSHMRCQLAVTLIALSKGVRLLTLPAEFNAANDLGHLEANGLSPDDARIIHYLRNDEVQREQVVLPENLLNIVSANYLNPLNRVLQRLLRGYGEAEFGMDFDMLTRTG